MKTQLPVALALVAIATAHPTMADESAPAVTGNVALARNYIWRGMTQTKDEAAISGGFDLVLDSGLYAGVWGSNVDFDANDNIELDYYGGYSRETGALSYDLGYIDYNYPGGSGDFEEWYLGLGITAGTVDLGATFSFGLDNANDNIELSAGTELSGIGLGITLGDYDNSGKYTVVSASKEIGGLELSLAWSDFDADSGNSSDEDAVTFTVAKSF